MDYTGQCNICVSSCPCLDEGCRCEPECQCPDCLSLREDTQSEEDAELV